MKIVIGNDHTGIDLKNNIFDYLVELGYDVKNIGINDNESTDYPKYALNLSEFILSGQADYGILICGTGVGMSIAANKINGIRAVVCSESFSAKLSKNHNNTNVLCLGARVLGSEYAKDIVCEWLKSEYQGGRHQKRIDQISKIEEKRIVT